MIYTPGRHTIRWLDAQEAQRGGRETCDSHSTDSCRRHRHLSAVPPPWVSSAGHSRRTGAWLLESHGRNGSEAYPRRHCALRLDQPAPLRIRTCRRDGIASLSAVKMAPARQDGCTWMTTDLRTVTRPESIMRTGRRRGSPFFDTARSFSGLAPERTIGKAMDDPKWRSSDCDAGTNLQPDLTAPSWYTLTLSPQRRTAPGRGYSTPLR